MPVYDRQIMSFPQDDRVSVVVPFGFHAGHNALQVVLLDGEQILERRCGFDFQRVCHRGCVLRDKKVIVEFLSDVVH